MSDEGNNAKWYSESIKDAASVAQLQQVAAEMRYDQWEKMDYTQDAALMDRLRTEYAKRLKELQGGC